MALEDKTLSCRDCQQTFVFSSGEQEFFAARNLSNEPKRCPNCRVNSKMQRDGKDPAQCTDVPCDDCGAIARVPFKPTGAKPVLCSACFQKTRITPTEND